MPVYDQWKKTVLSSDEHNNNNGACLRPTRTPPPVPTKSKCLAVVSPRLDVDTEASCKSKLDQLTEEIKALQASRISGTSYKTLQQDVHEIREDMALMRARFEKSIADFMAVMVDEKNASLRLTSEVERIKKAFFPIDE